MAAILGRSQGLVYLVVVVGLLFGSATPAFSLLVNSSNPLVCSNQCESKNCLDPFTLRYGKYCGVGYTGCSGAQPCDGLDSCCETHDQCIGTNLANYVNRTCNDNLKTCVNNFQKSGNAQFAGANCSASDVEKVIIGVVDLDNIVSFGYPSSLISLKWVAILAFISSVVFFHG